MGSVHWVKDSQDKFIVATENSMKLYETNKNSHKILISENKFKDILTHTVVTPMLSESDNKQLVAFGLSSNKSIILNFTNLDNFIEISDMRQVSCLEFKGMENKIMIGYDKTKDYCISLWDYNRASPSIISNLCGNDGVTSFCWNTDYTLFIAGLHSKHIRTYDFRQLDTSILTIPTKYTINGIQCSPNGNHILSHAENFFAIHDLRFCDKFVVQINTAKPIISAQWCPTIHNIVGVVQGDEILNLYEHINENCEPYVRTCYPFGKESKTNIASFSFKTKYEEKAIFLSNALDIVSFTFPPKSAVAFDMKHNDILLDATRHVKFISIKTSFDKEPEDILKTMQNRALIDYGLIADIKENGDLSNDIKLKSIWILLARMYDKGCMLGIKSILGIKDSNMMMLKSEYEYKEWCDYPTFEPLKIYKSDQRNKALSLCGWNTNEDGSLIESSDSNNYRDSCRSSLIACLQLKLKLAVEILKNACCDSVDQSNILRITAIVINNFNPDKHSTNEIIKEIQEPFLKAIFAFLYKNYEYILNDSDLPISDRMGFALKYLSDSSLVDFINNQSKICIETGDLNGILLVGASSEGVSLLQSYVDISDDIQSVALIASRFFTSEPFRIQYWIQTYRDMLDSWKLFDQRAQLDIMMNSRSTLPKAVQILCNFCGKSISPGIQEDNRNRFLINKISSCPNCRKTLTRCSLCMLHLGTCSTDFTDQFSKKATSIFQAKPFSNWFSWCQVTVSMYVFIFLLLIFFFFY